MLVVEIQVDQKLNLVKMEIDVDCVAAVVEIH
jgi:hypothetical protein